MRDDVEFFQQSRVHKANIIWVIPDGKRALCKRVKIKSVETLLFVSLFRYVSARRVKQICMKVQCIGRKPPLPQRRGIGRQPGLQ